MAKPKLILILCILILLSNYVSATNSIFCYQETANDSTVTSTNPTLANGRCNPIFNGSYAFNETPNTDPNNIYDGDWTTNTVFGIAPPTEYFVNYTKPSLATTNSLLMIRQRNDEGPFNLTINNTCFQTNNIQFKFHYNETTGNLDIFCNNQTNWIKMIDSSSFPIGIGTGLFEEAMWWEVPDVTNLSLTFIDETTNTLISGETFTVFLEKSDFSQTFSTTTNPFVIPNLDVDLFTKLKVSSTNYPERQYLNIDLRNGEIDSQINFTVFLINNTLGSEVLFNIVSVDGLAPLEGVRTVFTKIINGTSTVVAEEISDFAGQVVLTLNPDTQYTITFSKTGFQDRTILLEPKNADYLIQMVSTVGAYNQSVHEGIRYSFQPSNTVLNNNTKFNFTFTLNSTVWPLTNCTLKLFNGTILLSQSSSFTSTSCGISIELNTSIMTSIIAEGIYELDSQFEFTATQNYKVIFTYIGQFSLKNFLDDLSDFGMAGFDDFGRMILTLIVIFIITALAAQQVGFENREVLILIVIAQVWFFSSVNWLFLDFTPIPTIAGFNLKKYIIAILVTMAGGAFVIEKFTKP